MQTSAAGRDDVRQHTSPDFNEVRQRVALALTCKLDLSTALKQSGQDRRRLMGRVRRLIERERLRGFTRHFAYDLNRHIALKQVLDRLAEPEALPKVS